MQLLAPTTNDNMQPSMTTTSTPYNTRTNTPTEEPETSALAKITPLKKKKQDREKSRTRKPRRVSVRFFLN